MGLKGLGGLKGVSGEYGVSGGGKPQEVGESQGARGSQPLLNKYFGEGVTIPHTVWCRN